MNRRPAAAVLALCLLALAGCSGGGGQKGHGGFARHSGRELVVLTWNQCGIRAWGCSRTGTVAEKTAALRGVLRKNHVDVALLQETCEAVPDAMARSGPQRWSTAFEPYEERRGRAEAPVRCDGDRDGRAGTALVSRVGLASPWSPPSVQPDTGLQRDSVCAKLPARGTTVCSAHLTPHTAGRPDLRRRQLGDLIAAVSGARTAVFGGDFNTAPPRSGEGSPIAWPADYFTRYPECDGNDSPGGTPVTHTSGVKLDYVFSNLRRRGCRTIHSKLSDHSMVLMEMRYTHG